MSYVLFLFEKSPDKMETCRYTHVPEGGDCGQKHSNTTYTLVKANVY